MLRLSKEWNKILSSEFEHPYFCSLEPFVDQEYERNECCPPKNQIFNAFDLCAYYQLKVVIIGQDPYHGKGQANGLAFSVNDGIAHPPSLINIFKELNSDLGIGYPKSGDLSPWASQGVLLLNATLTVRTAEAASHQKQGWEIFTDKVIETISTNNNGIVFLLWGGYAQKKKKLIDAQRHLVLESGHPSPLSANRGYWFGNRHFSKCNAYLKSKGNTPIDWHLD